MTTDRLSQTSPIGDVISLTKPRLTSLVLLTAAGGAVLVPGPVPWVRLVWTLLGTACVVGAANAWNMILERDIDGLMERTKNRPLPANRLPVEAAWGMVITLMSVGLPMLSLAANGLTAALAAAAALIYALVYTPMKQHSPSALYVGAIPGALPPLIGWVAISGTIEWPALVLFAIMTAWQIPHFLGLALLLEPQYRRAGIAVLPTVAGHERTVRHLKRSAFGLLLVSMLIFTTGLAGPCSMVAVPGLGIGYVIQVMRNPERVGGTASWGRAAFLGSLLYLTLLMAVIGVDAYLV